MRAVKAGTYNKAKGAVKLKYSSSVISQIVADETQSCQAVYTSESGKTSRVSYLYAKCVASSASVNTTLKFMIKKQGQPWVVEAEYVFTGTGDKEFVLSDFLPEIPQLATMKITAVTSTGTASVSVNMTIV
jgi:hypothetical protein